MPTLDVSYHGQFGHIRPVKEIHHKTGTIDQSDYWSNDRKVTRYLAKKVMASCVDLYSVGARRIILSYAPYGASDMNGYNHIFPIMNACDWCGFVWSETYAISTRAHLVYPLSLLHSRLRDTEGCVDYESIDEDSISEVSESEIRRLIGLETMERIAGYALG